MVTPIVANANVPRTVAIRTQSSNYLRITPYSLSLMMRSTIFSLFQWGQRIAFYPSLGKCMTVAVCNQDDSCRMWDKMWEKRPARGVPIPMGSHFCVSVFRNSAPALVTLNQDMLPSEVAT
jgi:hypothetical protein